MQSINTFLDTLTLGEPASHAGLAVWPLLGADRAPDYLTLAEALATGQCRVSEISHDGSVPTLALDNGCERPVLIVDGDELRGARQNRIVNLSLLVPAGSTMEIPVSCVERGRWGYRGDTFFHAGEMLFAKARADKSRHVSYSLGLGQSARADQGQVWRDIGDKFARVEVLSDSDAMGDIYTRRADSLAGYVESFPVHEGQRGAVYAVDGRIAGMDVFESAAVYRAYAPRLAKSYGLDALTDAKGEQGRAPDAEGARAFLRELAGAPCKVHSSPGHGTQTRFDSEAGKLAGGALQWRERILHLCAFPLRGRDGHARDEGFFEDFDPPS
jgi:hypothetical protein